MTRIGPRAIASGWPPGIAGKSWVIVTGSSHSPPPGGCGSASQRRERGIAPAAPSAPNLEERRRNQADMITPGIWRFVSAQGYCPIFSFLSELAAQHPPDPEGVLQHTEPRPPERILDGRSPCHPARAPRSSSPARRCCRSRRRHSRWCPPERAVTGAHPSPSTRLRRSAAWR